MEKELLEVEKLVDANAQYDGKIDYLYFKLKLSMNMIYRYKLSYKALNIFKRIILCNKKYFSANKILKEINKTLEKNSPLFFKDLVFIRKVELLKKLRESEITAKAPRGLYDRAFINNLNKTFRVLHEHLYNCKLIDSENN